MFLCLSSASCDAIEAGAINDSCNALGQYAAVVDGSVLHMYRVLKSCATVRNDDETFV